MAQVVYDPEPQSIEHPGLRALYDYWHGRRPGPRLPGRQHLDPLDIPTLLPNVMLVDVVAPDDLRFRLVGTALVGWFGRDTTGLPLQTVYAAKDWERILADYRYSIRERRPCLSRRAIARAGGRQQPYQRLLLPLARDGERVDMLLAGVYWRDPPK
ncbi:MAG: hypothetical protein Kow00114_24470 [Kiloniellaceae bacterium]